MPNNRSKKKYITEWKIQNNKNKEKVTDAAKQGKKVGGGVGGDTSAMTNW